MSEVRKPFGSHLCFVGHSWGCGHFYNDFAKEWGKLGRDIGLALLIDPVPRPFRVFVPLNAWALVPWGKFRIRHTRRVILWRQVNGPPYGRPAKAHAAVTVEQTVFGSTRNLIKHKAPVDDRVVDPEMSHSRIDDAPDVTNRVYDEVESFINATRGF